jgi:dephospho-CoA kinase
MRVGLTGGIASGKSKVADLFAAHGVPIIDTDILARQLTEPGKPGLTAVVAAFGQEVLQPDGTLDRARLRSMVFADPAMRQRLDGILHPLILAAAMSTAAAAGGPYQIFAVPLLAETAFDKLMDRVLVVDCPVELQRQRLMSRDNESAKSADAMITAQTSREQRLKIADDVIVNDVTLQELKAAVERLHQQYLLRCVQDGEPKQT